MSDTMDLGPSFSPEEDAYFESGGGSVIPPEAGSVPAGGDAPIIDDKTPGADKDGTKGAPEKMVSLAALHEERATRKARDTELREAREKIANFEGRFAIIDKLNAPADAAAAAAAAAAKIPPTPEEDIFAAVKHVGETVAQMQKRQEDAEAATKAAAEETTQRETFVTNYKADAAKFTAATPDYMPAYNFLLNARAAELKAIGYDTPEALHNALNADEFAIAQMAFAKNKSPAEMLYNLAVQRGYKKAAAAEVDPDAPKGGEGTAAERLAKIAEGQEANKSLAQLGGEAPGGAMTAAQLMAMPMAEFEAWTEKNPAKAKKLMGG